MPEVNEEEFREWYDMWEKRLGLPYDPEYNYEGAFKAGVEPQPNFETKQFEWPQLSIDPDAEAEPEPALQTTEARTEMSVDEYGGVVATEIPGTDEYGSTVYKDPRDMKWEKPPPLGSRLIDKYARPALQFIGGTGGAIIGGGSGAVGGTAVAPGPGTIAGTATGGVAGGSLGYAIGDEIADILQEWLGYYEPKPVLMNLQEAGRNVREGAVWEMGGYSVGPAAKGIKGSRFGQWIGSMMPKTKGGAKQAAGEVLAAFTDKGPMIVKNMEEAKALEELIPGLKFDLGQLTGDVNIVKFVKEGVEDAGDLAVARAEQAARNTKAINDYIKRIKGKGETGDVLKKLKAKKGSVDEAEELAKANLERQQMAKEGQIDPMDIGEVLHAEGKAGELTAREEAGKLFDAVPEQNQNVGGLYEKFKKLMKPSHADEQADKFPKIIKKALETMEEGGEAAKADVIDISTKTGKKVVRGDQIEKVIQAHPSMKPPTTRWKDIDGYIKEWNSTFNKLSADGRRKVIDEDSVRKTGKIKEWSLSELKQLLTAETKAGITKVRKPKKFSVAHPEEIALHSGLNSAQLRAKHDIGVREIEKLRKAGKGDEAMVLSMENQKWREAAEILEGTHIGPGMDKYKEAIKKKPKGKGKRPKAKVASGDMTKSLSDLQGLRSEILEDLRDAVKYDKPHSLRYRLSQAVDAIDEILGGTEGGEGGQQLLAAQKYFRENVIEKYGKGTVGKMLSGEDRASIASKFFRSGPAGAQSAAEFMNVFGDNEAARTAMKEHVNQLVFELSSPNTGEITKAALGRFLKTHKNALNKLGLGQEYNSLAKARAVADDFLAKSKTFDKSVASRILKGDVNDLVKNAFARGSKKEAAEELMNLMNANIYTKGPVVKDRAGNMYTDGVSHPDIFQNLLEKWQKANPNATIAQKDAWIKNKGFQNGFFDLQGKYVSRKQMMKKVAADETYGLSQMEKDASQKALNGLQNAMVDEILLEAPYNGYPGELKPSSKMIDGFRKYDPALKVVFKNSPKKLKAMHTVRKAVKALEYRTGEKGIDQERYASNVITRIAYMQGHSMAAAADIAKKTANALKGISKEKVHKYINRGILDPEVAQELINAAKGGSQKKISLGIRRSLVRLGLVSTPKQEGKPEE